MAASGRERTLRVVLGALLSSDISASELRRFANDLARPEVADGLRWSLLSVLDSPSFEPRTADPARADDSERLFRYVKNKKLTKDQVISIVKVLLPGISKGQFEPSLPIRDILIEYADRVQDPYSRFTSFVEDEGRSDPYLRGIIGRSG